MTQAHPSRSATNRVSLPCQAWMGGTGLTPWSGNSDYLNKQWPVPSSPRTYYRDLDIRCPTVGSTEPTCVGRQPVPDN